MKAYHYGSQSKILVRAAFHVTGKWRFLRWPIVVALALAFCTLGPLSWLMVKIGEAGHTVAGWLALESRGW